jgi:hypothetical protein
MGRDRRSTGDAELARFDLSGTNINMVNPLLLFIYFRSLCSGIQPPHISKLTYSKNSSKSPQLPLIPPNNVSPHGGSNSRANRLLNLSASVFSRSSRIDKDRFGAVRTAKNSKQPTFSGSVVWGSSGFEIHHICRLQASSWAAKTSNSGDVDKVSVSQAGVLLRWGVGIVDS